METPPGSPLPPCRWHVSVTNCIDSEYFVGLHWVAFSLSLVASILGFWNLWYRRRRGHKIWKDGLTTFDSYIALMTIYVTGRVTHSVIIASGHMPNITFAQIIHDIPHSFALTGMWVYMLSVIEMTPAHATKFWLPNAKQIIWIRRTGYCYQIFVMTPLVTLCGLAWDQGHWDRFVTLTAVVYWAYAFDCGMLGLGFLLFGWQMTRIAATTLRDLKAGGQIGTVAGRRLRAQIEKSITKMKAVNISLGLAMAWFAIILLFFGFLQDQIYGVTWWSKIQAIGSELFGISAVLCNFCFIAWADYRGDDSDDAATMAAVTGITKLMEGKVEDESDIDTHGGRTAGAGL